MKIPPKISALYAKHVQLMNSMQDVFLLVVRAYIGYRFMRTGWGKLHNIPDIVEFFASLGIPAPTLNAYVASSIECFGGACLMLGLASRIVTVPLVATMCVAYVTADMEAVQAIFSDPDQFLKAAPFLYLMTSLMVLFFGPGKFSLDRLVFKSKS